MRDEIDEFGGQVLTDTLSISAPEPHDGGQGRTVNRMPSAAVTSIAAGQCSCATPEACAGGNPTPRRSADQTIIDTRTRSARGVPARDLPACTFVPPEMSLSADPVCPAVELLPPDDEAPGEPHESGPRAGVTHPRDAALTPPADGQEYGATHRAGAVGGACDDLRELWARRQAWHRAEKALTLQAKALCRRIVGGDKAAAEKLYRAAAGKAEHPLAAVALVSIAPLTAARDAIGRERAQVEKHIAKLGALTPLAGFVAATHGVGMLSLSGVIGEAGDLSLYANPAKLWKRMGLAVMPDGQRQRKVSGVAALDHGYSPQRRSLVWTIGDCFVKAGGPYREVYDQRKAYEAGRLDAEGEPLRPIVCHLRAKRYAEKRLLRDLWRHWRATLALPALDEAA